MEKYITLNDVTNIVKISCFATHDIICSTFDTKTAVEFYDNLIRLSKKMTLIATTNNYGSSNYFTLLVFYDKENMYKLEFTLPYATRYMSNQDMLLLKNTISYWEIISKDMSFMLRPK